MTRRERYEETQCYELQYESESGRKTWDKKRNIFIVMWENWRQFIGNRTLDKDRHKHRHYTHEYTRIHTYTFTFNTHVDMPKKHDSIERMHTNG